MKTRLVIFDLDETLVHAAMDRLARDFDFQVTPYYVHIRPYAQELLAFAAQHFDIAVWSSSSQAYVDRVVAQLIGERHPIQFAWADSKCVQKADAQSNGYVYIKDLRKVQKHGYTTDEIVIVDDSAEKIKRQPKCHLEVKSWFGDPDDRELLKVQDKLAALLEDSSRVKV